VVPEIVHSPGEALILDWGKLRDFIDPVTQKKKTVWAFVGTLGYSRFLMVRLVLSNSLETTIDAIESMLREMGGTPIKITSDNPKCFALEASQYEPLLNPGFELFAAHYGIQM
jgi:transposase